MRVVGGLFGGRTLVAPRGPRTRPTSDRVREAVFSILGPVDGLRVLDLFAGSGAMAIESLSRGAAEATLVDSSSQSIAAIRRNLQTLGLEATTVQQRAESFLDRARRDGRQYDLVFVDPPYRQASSLSERLSSALTPVLGPGARVVAESDRREPLELDLAPVDRRRYGDTLILIFNVRTR
jgi:16S rRNA (guanine966-N2)-methyltransferase